MPAFHITVLEDVQDKFGVLDEERTALILIEPESLLFDPGQSAAESKYKAVVGKVVEHENLLGGESDHATATPRPSIEQAAACRGRPRWRQGKSRPPSFTGKPN